MLKILIADDHLMFIEGLKYVLKQKLQVEVTGYALNGREALEKCNSKDYDIVLMDTHMPLMDGIEATTLIKKIYPYIKVIMLSTVNDLHTLALALKAGADAYVLKNAESYELTRAIQRINQNKIYISEGVARYFSITVSNKRAIQGYLHSVETLVSLREQSVLRLISEGHTNRQIADILFISVKTADTHRKNLLCKLKVNNTASLVKFAVENKLI